jgi:hypothetical protein
MASEGPTVANREAFLTRCAISWNDARLSWQLTQPSTCRRTLSASSGDSMPAANKVNGSVSH